jgi:hypothetical protein
VPPQIPEVPRPLRSARLPLALAVAGFAFEAAPRVPWPVGAVAGISFLAVACIRGGQSYVELRRLRQAADRLILHTSLASRSPFVEWRAGELLRPVWRRRRVVTPLRRLVRSLERSTLPGSAPVNRVVARAHLGELQQLLELVGDGRPVSARGLLLLDRFLTSPASALYARERAAAFETEVAMIRRELVRGFSPAGGNRRIQLEEHPLAEAEGFLSNGATKATDRRA